MFSRKTYDLHKLHKYTLKSKDLIYNQN